MASPLPRHRALALLSKCRGDEIWSVATCQNEGVPADWIEQLADTFESGYRTDSDTIYLHDRPTNQYHGVRDLDIAVRLARLLGVNVERVTANVATRPRIVAAIKEAIMDGE